MTDTLQIKTPSLLLLGQKSEVAIGTCLCASVAADFLIGAACCSSVENPGMVMFQERSVVDWGEGGNFYLANNRVCETYLGEVVGP